MPRLLFVHAYALYTTLKNTVLSSFCFKSHIQRLGFFFPCCVPPSFPPQKSSLQRTNPHSSVYLGGREEEGGGRATPLTKVHQNGWFGHEKQCQETGLSFICTTHRKRKREKKKESAWRMKLRYKLKLEGFLVRLSHSWPPRILLYNGLSTFFFLLQYNLLNFSVNKTESRYYRPAV